MVEYWREDKIKPTDGELDNFEFTWSDMEEMEQQLPCQRMRVLWDGFTLAVDTAVQSSGQWDIEYAASLYSDLVTNAESLPDNQAEFWIGRADNYLPTFWMVWMAWLEQPDEYKVFKLDS